MIDRGNSFFLIISTAYTISQTLAWWLRHRVSRIDLNGSDWSVKLKMKILLHQVRDRLYGDKWS